MYYMGNLCVAAAATLLNRTFSKHLYRKMVKTGERRHKISRCSRYAAWRTPSECQTSSFVDKNWQSGSFKIGISHFPYIALVMVNIACNVPFYPGDATIPRSHYCQTIPASNCFRWRRVHLCTNNDPSGHVGAGRRQEERSECLFLGL